MGTSTSFGPQPPQQVALLHEGILPLPLLWHTLPHMYPPP